MCYFFLQDTVYLSIKVLHKGTSVAAEFDPVAVKIDGTQSWTSLGRLETPYRRGYNKHITLSTK